MKKKFFLIFILVGFLVSCASKKEEEVKTKVAIKKAKHPVVTIETSGDLYFADDGDNIQLDFFGSCATGYQAIVIQVGKKKMPAPCKAGRYKYSFNLPQSIFKDEGKGKYVLRQIKAYHDGQSKLQATSYILIDRIKREIKSVLNRQVRFEKIPTGHFEPVTEFSTFGTCNDGSSVTIDITAKDRFGQRVSKFDDSKACKSSGFYFLSQMDGLVRRGMRFHIYETKTGIKDTRNPASNLGAKKPEIKNLFEWTVRLK